MQTDIGIVLNQIAQEPYEHRGILNSEMGLVVLMCRKHRIERVIETGRARGQSTYLLAKYLPECHIHSIELRPNHEDEAFALDRLAEFDNVTCWAGDGNEAVPMMVQDTQKRTAVLCDGPKGKAAVDIVRDSFEFPWVRIGFIHDMRRLDHGKPSPHRAAAVEGLDNCTFSDDPVFVEASSWMDANVIAVNGPCGPEHEKEFGSYGPTLGVFFNSKQQQAI